MEPEALHPVAIRSLAVAAQSVVESTLLSRARETFALFQHGFAY